MARRADTPGTPEGPPGPARTATTRRVRPVIDNTFWLLVLVVAVLAFLAWWRGGTAELVAGVEGGAGLLLRYALVIAVSFLAAGFAERLIPAERVQAWLGRDAGVRGLVVASFAGMITPAGPFVSMPIAAVLVRAGAAPSAVVTFLASWSLLALHRFIAWEVPILGLRFALLRYAACALLPLAVGLALRWLARV